MTFSKDKYPVAKTKCLYWENRKSKNAFFKKTTTENDNHLA